jgi:ribonucleoside-diphosphate reductase alpha chain
MPTASTSQILGNNECIEPYTSNIYYRNTVAGSFVIANKYLLDDLIKLDLWNDELKNQIIIQSGSIQNIHTIPEVLRNIYKTSWDLSQKILIDQSADRGIYVCQSQSLNLFLEDATFSKLSSMHMYSWSKGLKTGMYYLRTKAAAKAQQFTIEPAKKVDCEMCSG